MKEDIAQTIRVVLADIPDSTSLQSHEGGQRALRDLLVAYQTLAVARKDLSVLTEESKGSDLKDAISQLEPSQSMALLARYVASRRDANVGHQPASGPSVSPDVANLQTQIYILAIVLAVFIVLSIAGATYAVLVHLGIVTPGAVLHEMSSMLRDALKTLLGID